MVKEIWNEDYTLLENLILGLGSVERKFVKEDLKERLYSLGEEFGTWEFSTTETLLIFNKVYTVFFEMQEIYDEYLEEYTSHNTIIIESADIYDVEELLKANNIEYEKSRSSESIYLDKGEIRVSTHKRPAYEHGGVYYGHKYKEEYIVKDEIEMYHIVVEILKQKGVEVIETLKTIYR